MFSGTDRMFLYSTASDIGASSFAPAPVQFKVTIASNATRSIRVDWLQREFVGQGFLGSVLYPGDVYKQNYMSVAVSRGCPLQWSFTSAVSRSVRSDSICACYSRNISLFSH